MLNQSQKSSNIALLFVVILCAVLLRLVPHPPNFAPVGAIALFGGAHFRNRFSAFAVPLVVLFLSDLFIGFHRTMPFVYVGFSIIVLMGMLLRNRRSVLAVCCLSLATSLVFFVVSNFGFWALGTIYPKTATGLLSSYIAAIPFFQFTVAGDLFYCAIMFGGYEVASRQIPAFNGRRAAAA